MRSVPRRGQRGVALSSPVALLSVAAVVLAGAAFVLTGAGDEHRARPAAATSREHAHAPAATSAATPERARRRPKPAQKPPVRRGETYVEVFNNSGISGLAGSTAARAQGAGWQVVGSDNWYGTIPASTVYFPARLRAQAAARQGPRHRAAQAHHRADAAATG